MDFDTWMRCMLTGIAVASAGAFIIPWNERLSQVILYVGGFMMLVSFVGAIWTV